MVAGQGPEKSSKSGREQKAEQAIEQGKGVPVALGEGVGVISCTPAKNIASAGLK